MIGRTALRRALAVVAVVACAAGTALLWLDERPDGARLIVFEQARLRRVGDYTLLDARAEVQLPATVRQGLDSGVPLDFVLRLSIDEPRRYWFDRPRHRQEWRQRLVYYELTRHYRLTTESPDGGTERRGRNYRSLLAALDGLGTLRNLEATPLANDERSSLSPLTGSSPGPGSGSGSEPARDGAPWPASWRATLEMRLDARALPLPLQPLIGSAWQLRSAPYAWRPGATDRPARDGAEDARG